MNTSFEIPSVEVPASPSLSQPQKPPLLSEGLLEASPEGSCAADDWPENIVFEKYTNATDPAEKEKHLEELGRLVTKHALSVLYPAFHETRMDLANLALEAVLRYHPRFEGRDGAKFSSWVHKIVLNIRNKAISKMLRDRPFSQQFAEGVVPTDDEGELYIPSSSQESKVHAGILLEKIRESLHGEDRIMFDMVRERRTGAEMAEVLGGDENSVRCRWFRLKEKIQKKFPTISF